VSALAVALLLLFFALIAGGLAWASGLLDELRRRRGRRASYRSGAPEETDAEAEARRRRERLNVQPADPRRQLPGDWLDSPDWLEPRP
jgi:hypothetical protein